MHYVYFIKSGKDNSVYIGCTSSIEKRLKEHNQGKTRSTKSKRPYALIYSECYNSKTEALVREKELKNSWSKKETILKSLKY